MKVAYVCISHKPISPTTTGGIETFSIYLLNALTKLGCEVSLFAAQETDTSLFPGIKFYPTFSLADLAKTKDENLESKQFALNYTMFQYASLAKVLERKDEFDVIHFSCAQWYIPTILNQNINKPIVSTVHVNNLKESSLKYVLNSFKKTYLVNISNASSLSFASYENRETIYNGIDINLFPFQANSGNYFGWLGRIAPSKGLREALLATRQANVECIASGPKDFEEYYQKDIAPLLDEKSKLIEPLGIGAKDKFLSDAKAVLLPVQWEEPFGLVAVEAMACGTPVISFARGAIPEIVIDGITGFIVNSSEEDKRGDFIIKKTGIEGLVEAIQRLNSLSAQEYAKMRQDSRKRVEENFTTKIMAQNYEKIYSKALGTV
jgi:glycosyltransferase involved in cell wall biosynthesis